MDKEKQVKKLQAQEAKIEKKLHHLEGNRLVRFGKHFTRKVAEKVTDNKLTKGLSKHSFKEWKKNYVVVPRNDYKQLKTSVGFYQAKYRDAMLRANNLRNNLR